jgi:hypothetical protein
MIRNAETRLSRLEAVAVPAVSRRWHRVIGDSVEECGVAQASLIALGKTSQDDNFFFRLIVTPRDSQNGCCC